VSGFPSIGALNCPCLAALRGDAEFRDGIDFRGIRKKIGTRTASRSPFPANPLEIEVNKTLPRAQNSLLTRRSKTCVSN